MNKKSLVLLLVTCSFVTTSFAANIINKLLAKPNTTLHSVMKTHKTLKDNHSYTDFTGTWVGDCGYGPATLVIENDDDYIKFNGIPLSKIGHGLDSRITSDKDSTFTYNSSFEWNADGSELIWKYIDVSRYYVENSNSNINVDINKFSFTKKNNQLNIDGVWTSLEDTTQINPPTPVHCVFSKK